MNLDGVPDIGGIADLLRFWLSFAMSPERTLATHEGLGDISLDLLILLGAGLAISIFIVFVLGRMGWSEVPEVTKAIFGPLISRFTRSNLPSAALLPAVELFVFAATILLHVLAVTWVWVDQRLHLLNSNLGGSIFDSFNAAVAFLAFFIPLTTVGAVASGSISRAAPDRATKTAEITGTALGIVTLIFYPRALAALHPETTSMQAVTALAGWPVGLLL